MKSKIKMTIILSLALSFFFFSSCKREAIEEPSPFGPSSFSIILNVSANPNVLFAGGSRGMTTITASLKKYDGTPLSNKTIYFEIRNFWGWRADVGYFEGNATVKSKTTDGNGMVTVQYWGPLSEELTSNTTLYIYAHVAWEGKESISELCPLYVVYDVTKIIFELSASPNVIVAGETRASSTISATLKTTTDIPLANQTVYFEITDADGKKANIGYFEANQLVVTKVTDENGTATAVYYGPLAKELTENTTVYITVHVAWECCEPFPAEQCPIEIVRDVTEATLELSAQPNVLFAGDSHQASTITATLKTVGGAPLANKTIHFEITDEDGNKINTGYFENNQLVVTKVTDENGMATTTYYSPLADELTENINVYIAGSVAMEGDEFLSESAMIQIITDVTGSTLELSAQPNVLFAGDSRESSTITATLKTVGGAPIANQTIFFEITDVDGNSVNIGYFKNNQLVVTKVTDENGMATAKYFGPLEKELTENTNVYIAGSVTGEGDQLISDTVAIYIIKDITDATLELTAQPNVLFAGDTRQTSFITATLKTAGGAPIANKTIIFEITDENGDKLDVGYFKGNQSVVTTVTDKNGLATVRYHGPLAQELTENINVYIAATATIEGEDYASASVSIYVIMDVTDLSLEVSAHPNVLIAGTSRATSTIIAILKTAAGAPLAGFNIIFEIHDAAGNPVSIGYFEGSLSVVTKETDQNGIASTTYYGPLSSEVTGNTTVYISVTLQYEDDTFVTATAPISIIQD